jgi:hypothetical protein
MNNNSSESGGIFDLISIVRKIGEIMLKTNDNKQNRTVDEIPPEVWLEMPEELRKILLDAKKRKAKISYEVNSNSGIFGGKKVYDRVTVVITDKWRILTTSYNAKNGIKTFSGHYAGPLAGGGLFFDPETGGYAGSYIS